MPKPSTMWTARHIRFFVILLAVVTLLSAVWPVYRSFLTPDICVNEAWNAYYADDAVNGRKLYPSADQFITNNYPPLSYYVVGAFGKIFSDTILAGRLLSILAIVWLSWVVSRIILFLGGDSLAALVGGLYCASAFFRFFPGYAGMNDPQILAQAIMAAGFLGFLKAIRDDRRYVLPLVVMIAAGFFKHNIVAMPMVAFAWLLYERTKRFLSLAAIAAAVIAVGFALCHAAYGPDFWMNMRTPRTYKAKLILDAAATLQWPLVGMVIWLYAGFTLRRLATMKFCNLWVATGLFVFLLQRWSEGVAENAMFDLFIALSVAVGIAFANAEGVPLATWNAPERLRVGILMAVLIRLLTAPGNEGFRLVSDPSFQDEIRFREAAMLESVNRVRNTSGDVLTAASVSYRAGKPFFIDMFNFQQRAKAGNFPPDVLDGRIAAGTLTRIDPIPAHAWCNEAD